MDVRNWPDDRILQLPDSAFGRRWLVGVGVELGDGEPVFDIGEFALPEKCVIWEVSVSLPYAALSGVIVTLSLGDVLPANDVEFNALELLFGGIVAYTGLRGAFASNYASFFGVTLLKQLVLSSGRRIVGRFIRDTGSAIGVQVVVVVSSIPTEVPDCLLSV